MRIIAFSKWWWAQRDTVERAIFVFFCLWGLPCLISIFWIGEVGMILFLGGLSVVILSALVHTIFFNALLKSWHRFNDEHPTSEVHMWRILKGEPTPSNRRMRDDHYYP
jgi:hypothetical protein